LQELTGRADPAKDHGVENAVAIVKRVDQNGPLRG
jgi:hypothetical protein